MAKPILGKGAVRSIQAAVDLVFDRLRARVLGPQSVRKRIVVSYTPLHSLVGLYGQSALEEGAKPHLDTLQQVLEVAGGYLEGARERTKSRVVREVQAALTDAHRRGVETDLEIVLGGKLSEVWQETKGAVRRIVETEATHTRNLGVLEGVVRVNADAGIEDPTVYFVVVRDHSLCEECKRLHLLEDEVTPRVWRLSEVGAGYHRRGEPNPKMGGLHPNCRCSLSTLMPGYGFSAAGMVEYKSPGHDEFARQRALEKSEPLRKSTPEGRQLYDRLAPKWHESARQHDPDDYEEPSGHWVDAVQNAPITVNLPARKLQQAIEFGRLKNLFETGDAKYGEGLGNPSKLDRTYEEGRALEIPEDTPELHRPIYGALHVLHDHPYQGHVGGAYGYGDSWLVLHPSVKERSTFTPDDSFASGPEQVRTHHYPEQIAQLGAAQRGLRARVEEHRTGATPEAMKKWSLPISYLEAQIYGGVDFSKDVQEVHLPHDVYWHPDNHGVRQALGTLSRASGVKVVTHQHDPYENTWSKRQVLPEPTDQSSTPGSSAAAAPPAGPAGPAPGTRTSG